MMIEYVDRNDINKIDDETLTTLDDVNTENVDDNDNNVDEK